MNRKSIAVCFGALGLLGGSMAVHAETTAIEGTDGVIWYQYDGGSSEEQGEITYGGDCGCREMPETAGDVTASQPTAGEKKEAAMTDEQEEADKKQKQDDLLFEWEAQGESEGEGYVVSVEAAASTEMGMSQKEYQEYLEAEQKQQTEYEDAGIGMDEDGSWTFEGEKVYFLLDDAGGMYQNGSEEAKKGKIYLYVSRDEEGKIQKVEKISGKQLVEKMAERDEKKD